MINNPEQITESMNRFVDSVQELLKIMVEIFVSSGIDLLSEALVSMSKGFNILGNLGSDLESLTAPESKPLDFFEAKTSFNISGWYASTLMKYYKDAFEVNGSSFEDHIDWIYANRNLTKDICERLYAREGVSTDELEQAYNLHEEFRTALGNLIAVFDKIKSGEITVKWIDKIPILPDWTVPVAFKDK